ncbi:hypothetical protein MPTK1_3g16960 [Marchantia polymorpha subsp. ruderalis]|uniref:PH domain-containing protein n=2 Tax=Marchantia polymorpha TaxID=3197 RepID=A0AAF6B1M9_MARPO|nr:hypothetical protein MARPO_0039s0099 [Marchantia polymorpha]BBN05913.1 hypothetical protein Mp_3g16960 [Marchantia polymorpha subsp. ruderalis]|eukprot:PTQ40612.1 hypothetical protein MARPO_0039s0099 [Marchantia polymorpha]
MSSDSSTPLSDMAQMTDDDTQSSLEKIKKRLANASTSCIMEGSLLKRSETLRKWNQRWFTLDPATGKMEYRFQQGDSSPRGLIHFEPESTITLSPINFHGLRKYDGCCFYIGSPQKKEYYLCAETPTIARAWVSTLRAAALVLKAHKEAVDSLSGNGHAKLGTVAAVVAAANATAREGMKEMHMSLKEAVKPSPPQLSHTLTDDMSNVMKETLRVKDEELNQVARDLRARDFTIKEMADRLSETAEAAEAAASAARAMDKERKSAQAELERLRKEFDDRLYHAAREVRAGEERLNEAMKARDNALQEAQRWRVELGKGREQIVMMEGACVRAEESARRAAADVEEKVRLAKASEMAALAAKEEAFHLAKQWQAQAEYYRDQAARYLAILQERDAQAQAQTGKKEEGNNVEVSEKSDTETPVGVSTPDRNNPSFVDTGVDEDDLIYNPITPELLTAGSGSAYSDTEPTMDPELEAPVPATVDTVSTVDTEISKSPAVENATEVLNTAPSQVVAKGISVTELSTLNSGLPLEVPQLEEHLVSRSESNFVTPVPNEVSTPQTSGETIDIQTGRN